MAERKAVVKNADMVRALTHFWRWQSPWLPPLRVRSAACAPNDKRLLTPPSLPPPSTLPLCAALCSPRTCSRTPLTRPPRQWRSSTLRRTLQPTSRRSVRGPRRSPRRAHAWGPPFAWPPSPHPPAPRTRTLTLPHLPWRSRQKARAHLARGGGAQLWQLRDARGACSSPLSPRSRALPVTPARHLTLLARARAPSPPHRARPLARGRPSTLSTSTSARLPCCASRAGEGRGVGYRGRPRRQLGAVAGSVARLAGAVQRPPSYFCWAPC